MSKITGLILTLVALLLLAFAAISAAAFYKQKKKNETGKPVMVQKTIGNIAIKETGSAAKPESQSAGPIYYGVSTLSPEEELNAGRG